MDMTDAECAVVLAVAGIVLVGLIAALIHERLAVIGKNLVEEKDNEKMSNEKMSNEKMSNEKMNNEMPELKAGDLIKTSYGRLILAITPKAGYWLVYSDTTGSFEIGGFANIQKNEIVEICRDIPDGCFSSTTLRGIARGIDGGWHTLWKRETVKEMTVEQIEEQLGYKIKVVGDDR